MQIPVRQQLVENQKKTRENQRKPKEKKKKTAAPPYQVTTTIKRTTGTSTHTTSVQQTPRLSRRHSAQETRNPSEHSALSAAPPGPVLRPRSQNDSHTRGPHTPRKNEHEAIVSGTARRFRTPRADEAPITPAPNFRAPEEHPWRVPLEFSRPPQRFAGSSVAPAPLET